MTRETYLAIEGYMLHCMDDSAHDAEHVYRVLYNALEIAKAEPDTDYDVLIAACLLHDIGRADQFSDPSLCHAKVGSEKAFVFLTALGLSNSFCNHVCACIASHRFRREEPPASIEAKILFDADKLDVTGAMGIARTLLYQGTLQAPLYTLRNDGSISDGKDDLQETFFREYHFKLEKLYTQFFTSRGKELALQRRSAAAAFHDALLSEIRNTYENGQAQLHLYLNSP